MSDEPNRRHNAGPLSDEDARKLSNHIRALEILEEQKSEVAGDIKVRKSLATEDGFDTNIINLILKRHKAGAGQVAAADNILTLYEQALEDQGLLPLEKTRAPPKESGPTPIQEVALRLHGDPAPDDMFDTSDDEGEGVEPHIEESG